jgi:CDP-diacylglycerol---serine O-phosphatidyltransferase
MKLFTIPNLITLGNLLCGCLAIVCAFNGNLVWAAYLVGIAAVLDFLDGFLARALKQHSPIGKDLDSLADMVTFGVVPGVVMFQLMTAAVDFATAPHNQFGSLWVGGNLSRPFTSIQVLPYIAFLLTLFSALRLAKFNNDTRQSDSFIGVPTPANSILVCSLPLVAIQLMGTSWSDGLEHVWSNVYLIEAVQGRESLTFVIWSNMHWILLVIAVIMSYLLISELPLFALKFKSFRWKGNELRYSFLVTAVVMLVFLKFIALPLIIVLYILLSVVNNLMKPKVA